MGVCTALDELVQGVNHVRAVLMLEATPREVHEVAVQSMLYWGMLCSLRLMAILEQVLNEPGREAELTDTQWPLPAYKKCSSSVLYCKYLFLNWYLLNG